MTKKKCSYCADPDFFDEVLKPTPADQVIDLSPGMVRHGRHWPKPPVQKIKKLPPNMIHDGFDSIYGIDRSRIVLLKTPLIKRGKYRIKTVTDADMGPGYEGFKVEIIGTEMHSEPQVPRGAFLSRGRVGDKKTLYIYSNAARITHKDSSIIVDIHWTPEHGRIVNLHGFSRVATTPAELEIINTALKFNQGETRGAPKLDDDKLSMTIKRLGDSATQAAVATELDVDTSTLRRWVSKRGLGSWEEAKEIYRDYRSMNTW